VLGGWWRHTRSSASSALDGAVELVQIVLDRIAGILLTSIAVILLANGFTDLVLARAHGS
jgi:hypothetical protein